MCLYLYVSTCMCIHLHMSTSMCVYIPAKIAPSPSLLMCLYLCVHLYVYTPVCVYIYMCPHTHEDYPDAFSPDVPISICVYIYMCLHLLYGSTFVCVYIYMCPRTHEVTPMPSLLMCLFLYVSTCMCIHLYVSTSICVHIPTQITPMPSLLMCLFLYVSIPAIWVYICMRLRLHLYVSTYPHTVRERGNCPTYLQVSFDENRSLFQVSFHEYRSLFIPHLFPSRRMPAHGPRAGGLLFLSILLISKFIQFIYCVSIVYSCSALQCVVVCCSALQCSVLQ